MVALYVGSLDQGTSSTRFCIFNKNGEMISMSQKEHSQIMPQEGWVEHDPNEIWENTQFVMKDAMDKKKIETRDIAAIGITNQRETMLVWDKNTGKPLYNALVWMDVRSEKICQVLTKKIGKSWIEKKTGLSFVPYFSAPKLLWIKQNIEAVSQAILDEKAYFGTIDTWLMYLLSGGKKHFTDVTNASRTLLMNLDTLKWDDELCNIFNIPKHVLPTIVPSSKLLFHIENPKFFKGIPLSGVLGDQQAALFGQGCFEPGNAKNTYGTGCFLLMNTGERKVHSMHGLLTTVAYKLGDSKPHYCLEGSVTIGGAIVQWLRDNLGIINKLSEVEDLAMNVPNNGDIYFVPAFSGLYAPHWRQDSRGVIVGMTRFTNKNHIARASLEAIAFQCKDIFEAMEKDFNVKLSSLNVDGGAVVNKLLMQIQADILNKPLIQSSVVETTSLGAAFIAGLAVQFWKDLNELKSLTNQRGLTFLPKLSAIDRERLYKGWSKALERSHGWKDF